MDAAASLETKKPAIFNTIKRLVGSEFELTIRGERQFTITFPAHVDAAKAVKFLAKAAKVTAHTDDELQETFVYIDA